MNRISVDIAGAGPHIIIPARLGQRIMVQRVLLTFSHSEPQSQEMAFLSGDDVVVGPFYFLDGGTYEYERGESKHYAIRGNDPLKISMQPGMKAAGLIEYEVGSW